MKQLNLSEQRTLEVCFLNIDGSVSVHYRFDKDTDSAKEMIRDISKLNEKHGKQCRYFTRLV